MELKSYYGKGQFPGAKIKLPPLSNSKLKFTIKFTIDEALFAKVKQYRIWPSEVCKAALRREVRRRQKARADRARKKKAREIVNRYSGEVLTTS